MLKPIKTKHCTTGPAEQEADEKLHDMELRLKQQQRLLHRLYRKLEKEEGENRLKLNKFAEQRKVIRIMRREKQDLMFLRKMSPDPGKPNTENTASSSGAVQDMIAIYEDHVQLVEDCADSLVEIGHCVDYVIRLMYRYRNSIQQNFGTLKSSEEYARRQETLENRLQVYSTKFSKIMCDSQKIKLDIESWMTDREKFLRRLRGYKYHIGQSKILMNSYVSKANSAYDKYDDSRLQDKLIKKRSAMECQIFVSDLKDSTRLLRNDRYLRAFIATKCQERPFLEGDSDRLLRRMQTLVTNTKRLIPVYRRAFKLIADESGYPNVDHTLHVYLETEQHNFASFQYVINLEDIIYVLDGEINAMREKIFTQKKSRTLLHNDYVKKMKFRREENFFLNIERAQAVEQLHQATSNAEMLVQEVHKLFRLAGCNEQAVGKFLGNTHGLAVENVIPFLRILEVRILLLLRRREVMQRVKIGGRQTTTGIIFASGPKASHFPNRNKTFGGPFQPLVTIPNSFDTGENDDEDRKFAVRPLTYEEHWENCQKLASQAGSFMKAFVRTESASGDEESASNYSEPL